MVLYLIAVGRIKDPALHAACSEYATRFGRRHALKIVEVKSQRTAAAEGEALLKATPDGARRIALTRLGMSETSAGFAERFRGWRETARDVAIYLGGAEGLDSVVLDACEARISLSTFTLPHEMARLVLLEQLYRADTILHGEPYHKGAR